MGFKSISQFITIAIAIPIAIVDAVVDAVVDGGYSLIVLLLLLLLLLFVISIVVLLLVLLVSGLFTFHCWLSWSPIIICQQFLLDFAYSIVHFFACQKFII